MDLKQVVTRVSKDWRQISWDSNLFYGLFQFHRIVRALPSAASLRLMACRITFGSTSSSPSHGLVSNSRAPPFIAFTVMDISQWPERKVIDTLLRSAARRSWSSRPFRSGGDTSRMRHHGTADRGRARNSCADANVSG